MRLVICVLVFVLTGCAHLELQKCQQVGADDRRWCELSVDASGDWGCFVEHWARSRAPRRFHHCVYGTRKPYNADDYMTAADKTAASQAREADEKQLADQKAMCESDAKQRGGGYWECMRYHDEKAREERAERRRDADREEEEARAAALAEEREAEIWAEGIRGMGDAFQKESDPPKMTTCTTTPTYGGGATTVCH